MRKPDQPLSNEFVKGFSSWSTSVANLNDIDWTEQLSVLTGIADLITSELSIEEITKNIYSNVNMLMDAYQFAVGMYDADQSLITYRGMIENGRRLPDFTVNANAANRFASWCIKNEKEIFINDMDEEYMNYLEVKPMPLAGCDPRAAMYVPLKLSHKMVGLITVRTIHSNAYKQHHLHILKTVGDFIIRTIELSHVAKTTSHKKDRREWQWIKPERLTLKAGNALAMLTEREKEILLLLVSGIQNKAIAEKLFISSGTVKTHTINIYHKMDVSNRTSAIVKAMEWGWII